MHIRPAIEADAPRISALIHSLSQRLTVFPSGEGAEEFFATISEAAIRGYIASERYTYLVAERGEQLVGAVAMRDQRHLYHLFVSAELHGRGLGRRLWEEVCDAALVAGNPGELTVNASVDAVPVYERFGFVASGPRIEKHGAAFVPMRLGGEPEGG